MVDLMQSAEDQMEDMPFCTPRPPKPCYPWALRISLTHRELEKLGLPVPECGDVIDMRAFAEVTSVTFNDGPDGPCCRVELQIQKLSVENEMADSDDD